MSPSLGPASIQAREPMSPSHIWAFAPRHARARAGWPSGRGPGYDRLSPFLRSCVPLNELSLIDFTEADDPFGLFELWLAEAAAPRSTIRRRWRSRPSTPMGCPTRGWSCARARTHAVLCSTPTSRAPRAASSRANRGRQGSSTGSRSAVRPGSAGAVAELAGEESDAYFATRPRGSQIGAWASRQSRPLASRAALEAAVAAYERRFGGGEIPRPDHWRGYRLEPVEIEFWRDRPSRLHERLQFKRPSPGAPWEKRLLFRKADVIRESQLRIAAKFNQAEPSRPEARPNPSKEKALIPLDRLFRNEPFQGVTPTGGQKDVSPSPNLWPNQLEQPGRPREGQDHANLSFPLQPPAWDPDQRERSTICDFRRKSAKISFAPERRGRTPSAAAAVDFGPARALS